MSATLTPPETALRQLAHLFYFGYVSDKHLIDEDIIDDFIELQVVSMDHQGNSYLTLDGKFLAAAHAKAGDFDKFDLN
ncbi:unnamed protein product [marine sediment metagenome]|uniref:Uncharacterized protein n=1 Tax=marine sediment metagenome TaxID=412755 RepID=X0WG38_9ZZZZ